MNNEEIIRNIKRLYAYKLNSGDETQFRDACDIGISALLELKELKTAKIECVCGEIYHKHCKVFIRYNFCPECGVKL